MILQFLPSFNAGELSPLMDARVGLDKYLAGCRILKNFIPVPFGGVSKRPGTLSLVEVHNGSKKARVESFRFSTDTQYILEFGHNTLRFMGARRLVTNIGEFSHVNPWKTATPYANGGLVLDGSTYWRANVAHTANASNKFDAVPWKTVRSLVRTWTAGTVFAAGDVCRYAVSATDYGLFEAKLANTAAVGNAPVALGNTTWLRIPLTTAFWSTATASYPAKNGLLTSYARTLIGSLPVPCTYTRSTTTVTVTKTAHGLSTGETVDAEFLTGGALTGIYTLTGTPTADTFTFTTAASGTITTSAANYVKIATTATYARTLTTVTVTKTAHGRAIGDVLTVDFTSGGAADGPYIIQTVPTANTFTFSTVASGTIAGGATMRFEVRELWQSQITNAPDSNNDPGGTPPWATALPGPESVFVVTTPWTEDEIFDLQLRQINDIVIICHPLHEPQVLTRTHSDFFTLEPVSWDWPPLRDENINGAIKLTPSGTTGSITLTAAQDLFQPQHVGATWAIAWAAANRSAEIKVQSPVSATYTSSWLRVAGRWNAYSFNYWDGVFEIHRSFDDGLTFEVIRSYKGSNGDRNFNTSGEESKECTLRLKFIGQRFVYTGGVNYDARGVIEVIDHREWGLVKITAVTNSTSATATVTRTLPYNTATHIWAEGAFSEYRGFPRTVCLHAGRLFYGGSAAEPMRIWGSVTDDFYNFRRSSLADGSIAATIASVAQTAIQWLASGTSSLLVGTQGVEYVIEGSGDQPLGPGNVVARPQSSYGSAYMPAILVNYVTLFVERSRLGVREFLFSLERNGFIAADMTKLASHIVNPGLKQWAFQQSFNAVVWAVTTDGKLVGLTYEREENVVGWHRHETDGKFESVAILFGPEGGADEVYFIANRTIDGVERRFIELMQPDNFERQRDGDQAEVVMSDAAVVQRGTFAADSVLSGFSHLEGKTVQVLADGAKRPDAVVTGGTITLGDAASVVVVGLPFEALIQPMKAEVALRDGSAQTRGFKLHKLALRVWQSLGGEVRGDDTGADWQTINWRDTADPMGTVSPLFTGEKELSMDSRTGESLDFSVRSSDPHPLTITALAPKFDVSGIAVIPNR